MLLSGLLSGCADGKSTRFDFLVPRIYLHTYDDPGVVGAALTPDGVTIKTRKDVDRADADFMINGTGTLYWGKKVIKVQDDGIAVDGIYIESRSKGYHNVLLMKNGKIEKDNSIPFEPWWGYHPSKP